MISDSLSPLAVTPVLESSLGMGRIEAAAKDFESLFIAQMLEPMFGDSVGSELFGDDETKEVYKGLMMQEYGRLIAKSGGVGVADYIKTELLKLQEVSHDQ